MIRTNPNPIRPFEPRGTPKTLDDAIANGVRLSEGCSRAAVVACIEIHVRDFLSQRFTVAMLADPAIEALWKSIFEDAPKPPEDAL